MFTQFSAGIIGAIVKVVAGTAVGNFNAVSCKLHIHLIIVTVAGNHMSPGISLQLVAAVIAAVADGNPVENELLFLHKLFRTPDIGGANADVFAHLGKIEIIIFVGFGIKEDDVFRSIALVIIKGCRHMLAEIASAAFIAGALTQ